MLYKIVTVRMSYEMRKYLFTSNMNEVTIITILNLLDLLNQKSKAKCEIVMYGGLKDPKPYNVLQDLR